MKPSDGLWTSTLDEKTGSEWMEFCEYDKSQDVKGFTCTIKDDAKILEIDSVHDLHEIIKEYGMDFEIAEGVKRKVIDYEKLSKDFDGLHLTSKGQVKTRTTFPYNLNGWDAESTVFFRDVFGDCEEIDIKKYCR